MDRAQGWWSVVNSPLIITLLTAGVLGGGATLYADHRADLKDQSERRAAMTNLLVEYRQRLSALEVLDGQLDPWLGEGPGISKGQAANDDGQFDRASRSIGIKQLNVIRGAAGYVPSAPAYANVNLQAISAQIELNAGIPDRQGGALQLIGLLNAEPEIQWIGVRAWLPLMSDFYVRRHMLVVSRQLPLLPGRTLSLAQEMALGIPQPKAGELARIRAQSDERHRKLQNKLRGTEPAR